MLNYSKEVLFVICFVLFTGFVSVLSFEDFKDKHFGVARAQAAIQYLLPPQSTALKYQKPLQQRSFHFIAFQKDFIVDLKRFFPTDPVQLYYLKGLEIASNGSFIDEIGPLYQGEVRGTNKPSYAFGRFTETNHFLGYLLVYMLEAGLVEPIFIEPAGHTPKGELLISVYRAKDAYYPGCDYYFYGVTCTEGFNAELPVGGLKAQSNFRMHSNVMTKTQVDGHQMRVIASRRKLESDYHHDAATRKTSDVRTSRARNSHGKSYLHLAETKFRQTEPWKKELVNMTLVQNAITNISEEKSTLLLRKTSHNEYKEKKNLKCEVQFELDYSYSKARNFRYDSVLADVYALFAFVDRRLRQVDFDGDGESENIGLILKRVFIHVDRDQSVVLHSMSKYEERSKYLKQTWMWRTKARKESACLTVVLASRDFMGGIIGYSDGARVCRSGAPIFLSSETSKKHLPLATHFLSALAHVSRTFGVAIGDVGNCDVLNHRVTDERLGIHIKMLFNECRVRGALEFLLDAACLKENYGYNELCGNGVLDEEEICDCGPSHLCEEIDPCCCNCKYRSNRVDFCTQEHPCCNQSCLPVTKQARLRCGGECSPSTCNGNSALCPRASSLYDGKQCLTTTDTLDAMTCYHGSCELPKCESHLALKACRCSPDSLYQCHVCCMTRKGIRAPASVILHLYYKNEEGKPYLRPFNTSCGESRICNSDGVCERPVRLFAPKSFDKSVSQGLTAVKVTYFLIAVYTLRQSVRASNL